MNLQEKIRKLEEENEFLTKTQSEVRNLELNFFQKIKLMEEKFESLYSDY